MEETGSRWKTKFLSLQGGHFSLETATGLGKTRLVEVLNNLIENGKIERKGKSRGVKYGLKGGG
jgi:hypothetical protein